MGYNTHADMYASMQTHLLLCNSLSQQLSGVHFRMLQRVLDLSGYTWLVSLDLFVCVYK